jgi:hypothetical protein
MRATIPRSAARTRRGRLPSSAALLALLLAAGVATAQEAPGAGEASAAAGEAPGAEAASDEEAIDPRIEPGPDGIDWGTDEIGTRGLFDRKKPPPKKPVIVHNVPSETGETSGGRPHGMNLGQLPSYARQRRGQVQQDLQQLEPELEDPNLARRARAMSRRQWLQRESSTLTELETAESSLETMRGRRGRGNARERARTDREVSRLEKYTANLETLSRVQRQVGNAESTDRSRLPDDELASLNRYIAQGNRKIARLQQRIDRLRVPEPPAQPQPGPPVPPRQGRLGPPPSGPPPVPTPQPNVGQANQPGRP